MPHVELVESPEEQARRIARVDELNGDLVDRFTIAHLGAGAAAHRYGMSLGATFCAAIAFEFVEREAKRRWPSVFPNPTQDSPINMVGDVAAAVIGWKLSDIATRKLGRRRRRR